MTQTSQTPASKTARPKAAKKPRRGLTARDLLVRLTIPLVAAAMTFALHLQLNLEMSLAVLIALLAGTTLALMHVNYQRGTIIRELRRELLRATGPSHAPSRNAAQAQPIWQASATAPPSAAQAPAAAQDPVSTGHAWTAPPQKSPMHELPQLRGTMMDVGDAPMGSSKATMAPPVDTEPRLQTPVGSAPAGGAPLTHAAPFSNERLGVPPSFEAPHPQLQVPMPGASATQRGAPQSAMPPPLPVPPEATVSDRRPAPEMMTQPHRREAAEQRPELSPPMVREQRIVPLPIDRIASAATHLEPAAESDPRAMAPFWALRPGVAADPVTIPLDLQPRASTPDLAAGEPKQSPPPMRPARPPAAEAVDGPELEAMQKLIEQLATQLNGPRSAEQGPPSPAATQPAEAEISTEPPSPPPPSVAESVATSVAALRATADTMRQAADSAPPPKFPVPHQAAATETVRVKAPTATVERAEGQRPVAAPHAPATVGEQPRQSRYSRLAQASAAIADERIDVLLEPIMGLGDRKARHFEVSVRLRDEAGVPIGADDLAEIAADGGIMPKLDAAKMVRTARVANRLQARGTGASLFSTLAGESLADQTFLDIFDDVFADEPALSSRLVLSFSQSEVRQFSDGHWDAIEQMADMGLRLALEDVTDLDMDFESLREHGFDFVKLDAHVFLEGLQAPEGVLPAPEICRHFANMGLALIVGHIADETSLAKVFGFGVLFGQGELFGGPRPVSIETSAPPTTAAA